MPPAQALPAETPTPTAVGPTTTPSGDGLVPTATPSSVTSTSTPLSRPILPPTEVKIAKIGVDASVVLSDNQHLPQFRGVGWFLGSGYPGFRGNVVLFGHLNGQYETFSRLHELSPGDEVQVVADDQTYRYRVTEKKTVPKEAVEVLAPSSDSRLTLITCTGTFYPQTRDYSHRVVVVASLVQYRE